MFDSNITKLVVDMSKEDVVRSLRMIIVIQSSGAKEATEKLKGEKKSVKNLVMTCVMSMMMGLMMKKKEEKKDEN